MQFVRSIVTKLANVFSSKNFRFFCYIFSISFLNISYQLMINAYIDLSKVFMIVLASRNDSIMSAEKLFLIFL